MAPGFIDAHTHDDRAVLCGPECMLCKMSQGVTTVVVGNCGISLSPVRMKSRPVPPLDLLGDESWWTFDSFAEYAERLARDPSPVNTYALIGHMSLRVEAMDGDTQRAATDKEAAHMQRRLAEALAQGASGFSTGLYYPPNMMAPTDEVIAVAEALRDAGGVYVTHMRDEANDVLLSIEETLRIGRAVERAGGDQPPQMLHAGELRPLASRRCRGSMPLPPRSGSISTCIPTPPVRPC